MIEIYLLEQLAAFAKNGTLSDAAKQLHISQPALSRSMKKIEEEFGVPLFSRSKSRIMLNDTGKVAVEYAEKVLRANEEMLTQTLAFERSQRTLILGSCAFLPVNKLMPVLQETFQGMAITAETSDDERLIDGLKHHVYHLAILHKLPDDPDLFVRDYMTEHLCVSFPEDHPLASGDSISFHDLTGITILAHGGSGFWLDLCRHHLEESKVIVQDSMDTLSELVDASTLPVFNSDRAIERGYQPEGRITLPISDPAASVTYYLACLKSEKKRFQPIFHALL